MSENKGNKVFLGVGLLFVIIVISAVFLVSMPRKVIPQMVTIPCEDSLELPEGYLASFVLSASRNTNGCRIVQGYIDANGNQFSIKGSEQS